MPAEPWLADSDRLGELEHRDLRDPGQELQDPKPGDARQCLVMGAELPQRGIGEQRRRGHIKDSLWIIAGLIPVHWAVCARQLGVVARRRATRPLVSQQVPGHSWANSQSVWNRHSLMPFRPLATTACNSRILLCFWVSSASISV